MIKCDQMKHYYGYVKTYVGHTVSHELISLCTKPITSTCRS